MSGKAYVTSFSQQQRMRLNVLPPSTSLSTVIDKFPEILQKGKQTKIL